MRAAAAMPSAWCATCKKCKKGHYMETKTLIEYEQPTVQVVELKTETAVLVASKPDYDHEEW